MRNAIVLYILGLVFIVVAAMYLSGYLTGGGKTIITPITKTPGNGTNTTNTILQNSTVPTTSVYFSQCQSKNATEEIPNGNFSTGTYSEWIANGVGFGSAPFNLTHANAVGAYYGSPWRGYAGNFVATNYEGGTEIQVGNLTSRPFVVTEPYLNFRIVSPESNLDYIELLEGGKTSKYWYDSYNVSGNTNATTTFVNASIPLLDTTFFCQNVSIRIVADSPGASSILNYIAAGDFYLSKTPNSAPGILVNYSIS